MPTPRILAFAGSARTASFNKQLVAIAAEGARKAGAQVTLIDLSDYEMPLYHGDLEAAHGLPPGAIRLRELFLQHDGLLMACPEYNSSVAPLWKNTIDWISRGTKEHPTLACFANKAAVIMSASPGAGGGLRGLVHVRSILGNIRVLVLPEQISIPRANEAFGPDGNLIDPKQQASVEHLGAVLTRTLAKLLG